jgi:hypothetical protein
MQTVRVVLAGMPQLLRDVVRAVLAIEPGLAIVADLAGEAGALGDEPADVVVLTAGDGIADDIIAAALRRRDAVRLVIVSADGSRAYHCTPCGELSSAVLRDAVRGPATREPR